MLGSEQILYPVQILVTNVRLFGDNAQTRAGHIAEHTVKCWPVGIVLCGVIFNRYGTGDAAAVKRLLQKRHAGGHKLAADKLAFVLHGLGQRQAFAARRGAEIEHLLPRLFDGSARSDRSSDGKRSMGIGLSVCRTIVLAHGGVIRGDNRQEGGAVFTVTLPMKGENDED